MDQIEGDIVDILIDGKTFVQIGQIDAKLRKDAKVIDAGGKIVTPGIVDPHCHIGLFEDIVGNWVGNDGNEVTGPVYPELRGIDAVKPQDPAFKLALDAGVTTVVCGPGSADVIGGTFCALKTSGKTVEEMLIVEEIAMKCALGENPKRVYGSKGQAPATRMAIAALLREWLRKAKDYRAKKLEYAQAVKDGKTDAKEPEFNMKLESLSRVFDGMLIKIHAHQQDDIATAIRIIKEFGLNGSIEHCTEGWLIPKELKESGVKVIIGPTLGNRSKWELKNKSFESGKILYDHGILFGVMTDHPVITLDTTLVQLGQFVKAGLPWLEALKAVTINAAKVVGLEDRVGSVKAGKDADLVIWEQDPLHYLSKPVTVIVNGEII
jgi:imidazolonepropionase-like amidohydrolase